MKLHLFPARVLAALVFAASSITGFTAGPDVPRHPVGWEATPPLHMHPNATTAPVGYKPQQIRHAYGVDRLPNGGAGQTIGIVDAYGSPTVQNDLNVFCATFGLPTTTVQIVYAPAKPKKADAGWALETSLDVQWAHALAPNAKIVLAVAPSASMSDLLAAVDAAVNAGATVVSMSWGGSEFSTETSSTYESHFQKPGVTFFASSGDNGSVNSWPATSPSVVSVGGTSLYLDAAGNLTAPETGWSGSGGGFSTYFLRPAYQNGWHSSSKRAFPDVSLVADPNTGVAVYDSTSLNGQKGWFQVGGTSASAPMWAALVALANERRQAASKPTLSGANVPAYGLAGSTDGAGNPLYGYYFFDVIAGNNGGFSATPRYDEVTGLGTPNALNLVPALGSY